MPQHHPFCIPLLLLATLAGAGEVTPMQPPPPSNPAYPFDAAWNLVHGTGYGHASATRIKPGVRVHLVYESLMYALELADDPAPPALARIAAILGAVLPLQDRDPLSGSFGLWPWYGEEGVREMADPDHNWAEFMTAALLELEHLVGARLEPALQQRILAAIRDGALSIHRRNVTPGYSNIAVMGSVATMAAGERLREESLCVFGQALLTAVDRQVAAVGGFAEYNSTTYNTVVLVELERALLLVRDPAFRTRAEALRVRLWRLIGEQFHAPTGQWGGAKSRTYSDFLCGWPLGLIAARSGLPLSAHPMAKAPENDAWRHRPGLPIPADLLSLFQGGMPERVVVQRVGNAAAPEVLTTWHGATATLGTVDRSSTLWQRRPLVGYWTAPDEPAALLRLRLLKGEPGRAGTLEGEDLGCGRVHLAQERNRALVAASLLAAHGDHQGYLDKRADGRYPGQDLRLHVVLEGAGASVRQVGPARFELRCGATRAVIHGLADPGASIGAAAWRSGVAGRQAWVEAVLPLPEGILDIEAVRDLRLACAVEVLADGDPASGELPTDSVTDADWRQVRWAGLAVTVPRLLRPWY
jgi:hypothetical protein